MPARRGHLNLAAKGFCEADMSVKAINFEKIYVLGLSQLNAFVYLVMSSW
jgi:hypothetical protein